MSRRRRGRAPDEGTTPETFPWPWAVFGASLLARLLFWRATPDAAWPHTAALKGDALLWLEYARSISSGVPFELGLPIHPPGAAYVLSALWDGGSLAPAKAAWCAMGAAAAGLFTASIARAFGARVAACAGVILAASSGLLMLSASLNVETPYLLLVAAGFYVLPGDEERPATLRVAAWAALQGLACLFRVEHVLFAGLASALLVVRGGRAAGARAAAAMAAAVAVSFAAPLVPWHVKAWRAVARFNREAPPPPPPVRMLLDALAAMPWDAAARARREALPAFARDNMAAFVAAAAAHRGRTAVTEADVAAIEDAFGTVPRPLAPRPFVSLYGPLNFALASHPFAGAGFGHAALDEPPPLRGGREAYPPMLVAGLPPRELAFTYPPHVALVNDGYAMGRRWLAADPARAARRAAVRLWRFWSGAATALTGYGLPAGLSGTRHAVDVLVADGWIAEGWRALALVACLAGVAQAWRRPALWPWILFLATKAAAAVLFFGYARLGATAIPATSLLLGLVLAPRLPEAAGRRPLGIALAAVAVIEVARLLHAPGLLIDGAEATRLRDPVPAADQADHSVRYVY
jgi:hypothetical protein